MKKLFIPLVALIVMIASCKPKVEETGKISIIPIPDSIEQSPGFFTINKNTRIVEPENIGNADVTTYFKMYMMQSSGIDLGFGKPSDKKNVIRFEFADNEDLGKEGYELLVTKDLVTIRANESNGLFYGVQSLLQLLPAEVFSEPNNKDIVWSIPCCRIYDKPRFSWRGMHLDVSRHFFPVEFIKRYIDLIAMHKMNIFHWHLTDDNGWRIEIKKYPKLTEIGAWRVDREDMPWREATPPQAGEKATYGGFYTQDEIKEIIQYATERHVEVIPEIEMPGHTSEVFAAYPELSCMEKQLFVQPGSYWPNEDIFCAGKEETFEFIENVLLEVIDLFPSEYIHIGGDEANKTMWKKCPKCQQRIKDEHLANEDELQSWFIQRVGTFLTDHNKKMIGWDEIMEGGLAPNATVMSWRGFEGGRQAAEMNHDVIMCPTSYCYFDYYQANPDFEPEAIGGFTSLKKVYSFVPVPEDLPQGKVNYIIGGQGNVWTEYIKTPEQAEYMALPRMTALAEVLWSKKENRNWDNFNERLQDQFKRFDHMEVNYARGSWKVNIVPQMENGVYKVVLEAEQYKIPIHFTTDGTEPSQNSALYKEPIMISKSAVIKAGLFKDGKLMEIASMKEIVFHKAVGKNMSLANKPADQYAANGPMSLVDGLLGSEDFKDGFWLGFHGNDLVAKINLEESLPINEISVNFFQNTGAWIFMPEKITFTIFDNSGNVLAEQELIPETTMEAKGTVIEEMKSSFENITGQIIKVEAKNIGIIPSWHEGAGNKGWLFADEIIVR